MKLRVIGLGALAMLIAGCGTLTSINGAGQPKSGLVWPALNDITFDHHRGTYGDLNRINLIHDGLTRDEIYDLIGRPQFHEGFHTHEWDYAFYFRKPEGGEWVCQYKILFDDNYIARNMYWRGENCPPTAPQPPQPEPEQRHFTFSADALFRFNGGQEADLLPGGKRDLDQLVTATRGEDIHSIKIYGYTDRIGSDSYNLRLSAERANTVRNYLIMNGISKDVITARGMGEANPVVQCNERNTNALIACLQPNRRVEVEIN